MKTRPGLKSWRRGETADKLLLVLLFASLFQGSVRAGEPLAAGDWSGTFLTHDEVLYNMAYKVRYGEDSEADKVKITMINLDLEPRSKFTNTLSEIEIDKSKLRFKIVRKFETKDCSLEFTDGAYSGKCTSDAGKADEFSQITMVPPQADENKDDEKDD